MKQYAVTTHAIREMEKECLRRWQESEAAFTEIVTAEDYVVAGLCDNRTKVERLKLLASGDLYCQLLEATEPELRLYGDLAVVTAELKISGQCEKQDVSGVYQHMRIYALRRGEWRPLGGKLAALEAPNS